MTGAYIAERYEEHFTAAGELEAGVGIFGADILDGLDAELQTVSGDFYEFKYGIR